MIEWIFPICSRLPWFRLNEQLAAVVIFVSFVNFHSISGHCLSVFLVLAKRKINTDFCSSFLFTPENFTHTRVRLFNRIYSFSFLFKSYKIFIIFSFYMNTLNVFVCGWVWWGQRDSWIIYQFQIGYPKICYHQCINKNVYHMKIKTDEKTDNKRCKSCCSFFFLLD